ncbi:MAG TPA: hypothetical protein VFC53_13750 [Dehalococcoidia bacterium]|nr:hypothetical protein [Dehalococcoidia bacterium]
MRFEERPELPLTPLRRVLVVVGLAMFAAELLVGVLVAPRITGEQANAGALIALWASAVPWSAATALLIVRQADLPDVATASFVVTIAVFGAFALAAALDARGTKAEVNVPDALFLGVTVGAMTALLVWGIAMGAAKLLRLPTTEGLRAGR